MSDAGVKGCCPDHHGSFHRVAMLVISVSQSLSRVRLCDPVGFSMPGFPVHHQFPEPTQTHVRIE